MLVEYLLENVHDAFVDSEKFEFIRNKFSEYKGETKLSIDDEMKFLLELKDDTYREGYSLLQEGKREDALKTIAISNIIHSMIFDPDFYK